MQDIQNKLTKMQQMLNDIEDNIYEIKNMMIESQELLFDLSITSKNDVNI